MGGYGGVSSEMGGEQMEPETEGQHPVRLVMEYPEQVSRAQAFFFGIFPVGMFALIPQIIVMYGLAIAMAFINFIAFWAILFTGRYPRGMWEFMRKTVRYVVRIQVFMGARMSGFPPMMPSGDYPVDIVAPYPEKSSRLWLFLAWIAVFPVAIVNGIFGIAGVFLQFLGIWAVLFTGRFPMGWWEFIRKVDQQRIRMMFFQLWLRNEYPPFGLDD